MLGFSQIQPPCLPILVPEGTVITSALTVCPYIAIYKTDTFFYFYLSQARLLQGVFFSKARSGALTRSTP